MIPGLLKLASKHKPSNEQGANDKSANYDPKSSPLECK